MAKIQLFLNPQKFSSFFYPSPLKKIAPLDGLDRLDGLDGLDGLDQPGPAWTDWTGPRLSRGIDDQG